MARTWSMTVHGVPRTKKTSNEIHLTVHKKHVRGWVQGLAGKVAIGATPGELMRAVLMKVKVQPSKLWRQWAKNAPMTVQLDGFNGEPAYPIEAELHCCAVFYRERAIGDLTGYMQGLADLLEQRQIVKNDRQLVCWDGSRMDKDKERPRVELTLTEVGDVPPATDGGNDAAQESLPLDG